MIRSERPEYAFSDAEVKALARLLRRSDPAQTAGLAAFGRFIEGEVFQMMTIEEAEVFFDER